MATLFERLIGVNIPDGEPDPEQQEISIHSFTAALSEFMRGKLGGSALVDMFSLDASQTQEAVFLNNLLVDSPDKTRFMRVLKDWLYLGEDEMEGRYMSVTNLVARLQEEVTDQGGTVS